MTRINKHLAECGVCSRRAAEDLIRAGKICVNGEIVTDLATQIADTDVVEVNGAKIARQPEKIYILLNKPAGVVTTCCDQFGRKTVIDVIKSHTPSAIADTPFSKRGIPRIFPVGRLDYDTEGLLILTNDGEFARKITHPSSEIEKTYAARLNKQPNEQQLNRLRAGAGFNPPKNLLVSGTVVKITICEGKNRQVRQMFGSVGLRVMRLRRTQIGSLTLDDLPVGEWRYLTQKEIVCLFQKKVIL